MNQRRESIKVLPCCDPQSQRAQHQAWQAVLPASPDILDPTGSRRRAVGSRMRPMSEEIELERGVGSDATDGLIVDRPWSAASARGMSQPAKAEPVPIHRGMTVAEGFE